MILLSGKVGYRRLYGPVEGNLDRAVLVFGRCIGERGVCSRRASSKPLKRAWARRRDRAVRAGDWKWMNDSGSMMGVEAVGFVGVHRGLLELSGDSVGM